MNYFAECLARFQALPEKTKEIFGGAEIYLAIKEIEDKYKVKLSFLLILIVLNELEEVDIEDYLVAKFNTPIETAKKIKEEFSKVLDKAFEDLEKASLSFSESETNNSAGKEDLLTLFSKRLVESLKADADTIFSLNIFIFKTLDREPMLGEKIINILYNNSELLTSKRLVYEDKEVSPAISNWIKDFIRVNGSGIFTEVTLAQYLSSSSNAKFLNSEEKDLLRKVLKLYRNLVFYPESMDDFSIEDWQIIPFEKTELKEEQFIDVLDDSYSKDRSKLELKVVPKTISKPQNISQTNSQINPQNNSQSNPLDELQNALPNYNPGSLEHKALTQEIDRLKNKK